MSPSSTSSEISAAIGGVSGLKAIIKAVQDSNRLKVLGDSSDIHLYIDVLTSLASLIPQAIWVSIYDKGLYMF